MIEERRLFARLTIFAGLFFASTAVIPGGGAGDAGDAGGGGDAGDGGDDAGGDDGAEGAGSGDGEIGDDDAGDGGDADQPDDGDAGELEGDTKPSPKAESEAIKKALEKLRESDPESAKILRKQFFKQEQALNGYRESFKTPAEAVAARDLIESVGGETGLGEIQNEVKEYANELSSMAEGNPKIVEDLARDFPKGLVKLTPHAVSRLKQIDMATYTQRVAAPGTVDVLNMTSGSLGGTTPLHAMERLIELIGDGKQTDAHALASGLKKWAADVQAYAKSAPTTQGVDDDDPDRKALNAERAEVQTEKQRIFTQQVSTAIMSRFSRIVDQHLAPYLKKAKLTPVQRKETQNAIRNRISGTLERDKTYQGRLKALLEKGDVRAIERFVGSHVSQRAAKAAAAEWSSRGYGGNRTASANGRTGAVTTVSSKPKPEDVDWSKDPRRMRYTGDGITGEYTDKKGNVRRFKW